MTTGEVRKGATVTDLAAALQTKAVEKRRRIADLLRELRPRAEALGVPLTAPRLVTMRSAHSLLGDLAGAPNALATIEALAVTPLETSEAAVSRLLASVEALLGSVSAASWDIIDAALGLSDHGNAAALGLREKIAEAFAADEHVVPLKPVIQEAQARAARLLADLRARRPESPLPPSPPPPLPPSHDEEVLDERTEAVLEATEATVALEELRTRLAAEPGSKLTIRWRLTRPRHGGRG